MGIKKTKRILELEEKISMDLGEWLKLKYIQEEKSTPWIMKELGISSHTIVKYFKMYGIEARKPSERYKTWWDNITEEEKAKFSKELSERAKINLVKNRNKTIISKRKDRVVPVGMSLKEYMKTPEYRMKLSKANGGKNNAMYKEDLSEEHRIKTRGIFGYKKWSRQIRERDNYTCQVCGLHTKEPNKLHAHHLESYDTHPELRLELSNGITICNSCHNSFHNRHKGEKTNKEQFIEFQADKCL